MTGNRFENIIGFAAIISMLLLSNSALAVGTVAAIDKNEFTNNTGKVETDFHLSIGGHFSGKPKSDKFPNVTGGSGKPIVGNGSADFNGGNVPIGGTLTVSFESDAGKNKPHGYFTPDGDQAHEVFSFAGGSEVAFIPSGAGYLATFDFINTDFGSLTGSLTAYVNNDISHFNLDEFDTLFNAQTILSLPNYSFGLDQGISNITANINTDQYILIVGTANAGDGSGLHPFSLGLAAIPEPSTWLMFGTGVLGLLGHGWRRRKLAA